MLVWNQVKIDNFYWCAKTGHERKCTFFFNFTSQLPQCLMTLHIQVIDFCDSMSDQGRPKNVRLLISDGEM